MNALIVGSKFTRTTCKAKFATFAQDRSQPQKSIVDENKIQTRRFLTGLCCWSVITVRRFAFDCQLTPVISSIQK